MYKQMLLETQYGEQVCIIRTSDGAHISTDETHHDWIQYQAWLAEGNTPEEWQPETEPASEPVIEETPADSTEEEPVTEDGN